MDQLLAADVEPGERVCVSPCTHLTLVSCTDGSSMRVLYLLASGAWTSTCRGLESVFVIFDAGHSDIFDPVGCKNAGPRTPPDTPPSHSHLRQRRATPIRRRSALKARSPISESSCAPEIPHYLASMDTRSSSIVAPSSDGTGAMLFSRAHLRSPSSGLLDWRPRSCNALRVYRRNVVDVTRRSSSWNAGPSNGTGKVGQRPGGGTSQASPRSNARAPDPGTPSPSFSERRLTSVKSPAPSMIAGRVRGSRGTVQALKRADELRSDSGDTSKLRSAKTEMVRDSDQETARSSSRENSPSEDVYTESREARKLAKVPYHGGGDEGGGRDTLLGYTRSLGATKPANGSSSTTALKHRYRRSLSTGSVETNSVSVKFLLTR